MRFAGKRLLALLRNHGLPRGIGGWAGELGPDLAISTAIGLVNQDPRLALGDFVTAAGSSLFGRGVGALGAGVFLGPRAARTAANYGGLIGGVAGPMVLENPRARQLREEQEKQLLAEQQLREQGIFEQGIMAGAQQIAAGPRVQTADEIAAQLGFYA